MAKFLTPLTDTTKPGGRRPTRTPQSDRPAAGHTAAQSGQCLLNAAGSRSAASARISIIPLVGWPQTEVRPAERIRELVPAILYPLLFRPPVTAAGVWPGQMWMCGVGRVVPEIPLSSLHRRREAEHGSGV
jgi:hypothetical protein